MLGPCHRSFKLVLSNQWDPVLVGPACVGERWRGAGKCADSSQGVVDGLKVGVAFERSASDPGDEVRYLDRVSGLGVRVVAVRSPDPNGDGRRR